MNPVRELHRHVSFILTATFFLAFPILLFPSPIQAQQLPPIQMQAEAGFGGVYKEGYWIPVRIILENNGPNFSGKITASLLPANSGNSTFSYTLDLPSISRKEITLYVFPVVNYASDLEIALYESNAKIPTEIRTLPLTRLSSTDVLTGVIAANPSGYNILSLLDPPNGTARVENLSITDLPESVHGLGALDIMVISGVDTGQMNDLQRSAVEEWVSWGGHLILTGGPDWQKTASGLQTSAILPLNPDTSITIQNPELGNLLDSIVMFSGSNQPLPGGIGSLVLSTGSKDPEAQVLLSLSGSAGIPLIVRKNLGKGQIVYLAFDLSAAPFRGWIGSEELYRGLIRTDVMDQQWGNGFQDWQMANQAAQTLPSLGLPPFFLICGFLLFYIAIIGPVNFYLLRFLKRRELGWITIPALVLFFSILVFISGSLSRGQGPVSHRLSVVQIMGNSTHARVNGVMGIYSPNRATYEVTTKNATVLHNLPASGIGQVEEAEIIQNGDAFTISDLRVDVGGVYPLAYQSSISAPIFSTQLRLNVQESGTVLKGRIANDSTINLEEAVLLTTSGVVQVGDMGVGKFVEIDQLLDTSQTSNITTIPNVFRSAPGAVPAPMVNLPGNTVEQILGTYDYYQNRSLYRKYALLTATLGYSAGNLIQGNEVYLLGWSKQTPVDIDIVNKNETDDNLTLYIVYIEPEVHLEGDRWTLSPGFFHWALIDPQRKDVSPYNQYVYSPTSYGLVFSPAYELDFSRVVSLTLHLQNPYQSGQVNTAVFELWDFELQDWAQIDNPVWGDNPIDSPSRFVAATTGKDPLGAYQPGTIRLNVQTTSGYMEISASDFTLVVSR